MQDPNPPTSYSTTYYDPSETRERGRSANRSTESQSRSRRQSTYYDDDGDLGGYTYKHYHTSSLERKPFNPPPTPYPTISTTKDLHSITSSSEDQSQNQEDLSFSEEERTRKKLRNKEILAATFATITSVAAVTSIYQSLDDQQKRREKLRRGELTPEEARKQKNKSIMFDLVNVGSAALGVNSAVNGWKRMQAQKLETQKAREAFEERRAWREEQERALREGEEVYYYGFEGRGREHDEKHVR